ncbi:MAG TPA: phosphatase PAP2 family protein, partial [Acidimicrobiales bacterium]|nr:phosphatase PAP2 family protein [Acidimicrobiales bacterium]
AFCTAFVLADSDTQTAANVGFAAAVAASRVHLKAHHPTDVIGGAAIGSVLGLGLRPLVNLVTPGSRHGRLPARAGSRRATRRRGGKRRTRDARGMDTSEVVFEQL